MKHPVDVWNSSGTLQTVWKVDRNEIFNEKLAEIFEIRVFCNNFSEIGTNRLGKDLLAVQIA